jgi:hypothetical protein
MGERLVLSAVRGARGNVQALAGRGFHSLTAQLNLGRF